jgi:negative regulator of replication initiation
MKSVELSDETYAALQRLAHTHGIPAADVLAALLGAGPAPQGDELLFHLLGADFARLSDPIDRYLALLAWVARHHATDFADFISHQDSARRYLLLGHEAVNRIRERNHARQIDGTQYWAVMGLDDGARAAFVRRLLEFIGCHDETVAQSLRLLGLEGAARHPFRLLSA